MVQPQPMSEKTRSHRRPINWSDEVPTRLACCRGEGSRIYLSLAVIFAFLILVLTNSAAAVPVNNPPILISEPTSTRAIALESLTLMREPFALVAPYGGSGQRTRIMIFAMNLSLQIGEDLSVVSADAEDATHRHYVLTVESIRPVPSYEWMSAVVFKLNDDMGDVGDVLVSVSYRGVMSNRVRIAIGHMGGGPADDSGSTPTPAPPYTISGQLSGTGGQGLSGVSVMLGGAQTETVVTGQGGLYSFTVNKVGDYTITPTANAYYTFVPQTFSSLHLSQVANFAGTLRSYTVSGRLMIGPDAAAGVVVRVSGSQAATATTNSNGEYSFSLLAGGNYTITPALTYHDIQPVSLVLTDLNTDQLNRNFRATRHSYAISGKLKNQNGDSLAGITVNLTGGQQQTTLTDSSGNYQFQNVPAGFNYTVTPVTNAYYSFTSQGFPDLINNQVADFAGTRRSYVVSGRLRNQGGNSLAGITVNLTGAQQRNTLTDGSGDYQFTGVPAGSDYTVTPLTNDYYSFTSSQSFIDLHDNQVADFAGTLRFYFVSGWVQLGPYPTVDLVVPISGSETTTVTTDENGNYAISLPAGGNYTITPSVTYYTFDPISQIVTDLKSHQINRFFVGTRQLFTIRGKIKDQENNGLSGITVNLTGAEQRTTVTDGSGNYQFPNLLSGYNYTVSTPSTPSYTFPAGQNVVDLRNDQTLDFIGLRRLLLSGQMKDQNGNGIIGVWMTLAGTESAITRTSADGSYSLTATATGNYTVTPSVAQDYYSFVPANLQFNNLAGPQVTDFTATLAPVPDPQYVLEFDGQPKTVDYLNFWPEGVDLGHFFWEFWAKPGGGAGATYLLSDGYGGAHALLFGVGSFNSSESNRYELLGNIFDGVQHLNYFGSDVGPAVGEWGHFAVGWDGQSIVTYFNGVPVGKTPFAGPRRTPGPGGGGGRLLIGGSDHSNFIGRIAQVRGFEGENPREDLPGGAETSFAPETVFGLGGNLLSYYFRSGSAVADLSRGYNGTAHQGYVRGTTLGVPADCGACPPPQFVFDPTAPNFATGAPPAPIDVPPAMAPPSEASVFDSFARPNSTYTFDGLGGLGSTEGGSAGTQVWQTNEAPATPQPFGILNARAVLLANSMAVAWVPTGSAAGDIDVRVNRFTGRWGSGIHTGLSFRVVDADNFFFAYTTGTGDTQSPKAVRVGYYLNGLRIDLTPGVAMPSNWTTLRVVTTNSGDLKVYIDGSLVFSTINPLLASATGAGLYNNSSGLGLVNRWDNFTVFAVP